MKGVEKELVNDLNAMNEKIERHFSNTSDCRKVISVFSNAKRDWF